MKDDLHGEFRIFIIFLIYMLFEGVYEINSLVDKKCDIPKNHGIFSLG